MRVISEELAENFCIVAEPNVGICLYLVMGKSAKCVTQSNRIPPIQFVNKTFVMRRDNSQQMNEKHLPNAELKLVQEINYKRAENIESQWTKAI
jgi:hypothetical protein